MKPIAKHIERTGYLRLTAYLAGIFVASRIIFYLFGIRFDDEGIGFFAYLDVELLRYKLLESLYYMHMQPPLFNLFLGLVLKAFPAGYTLAFNAVYLICGFALYSIVVLVQIRLGISRLLAIALGTLFVVSPAAVLYENLLFYTLPLAAMLAISVFAFDYYLRNRGFWPLIALFVSLAIICGMRSLYHIAYFAALIAFLLIIRKEDWKRILTTAALPLGFVASLYLKNFLLFGILTTSSWFGMNFSAMTVANLPIEEREALAASGEISEVSPVPRFAALSEYPGEYAEDERYPDIETLHTPFRSNGLKNFNHIAYLGISKQYLRDSLYVLKRYPNLYAISVVKAWNIYFRPATDFGFLNGSGNRDKVRGYVAINDYLTAGKIPFDLRAIAPLREVSETPVYIYLINLIILPLLVVFGAFVGFNKKWAVKLGIDRKARFTILLICYNIIYVAIVANSLDYSENMRFRFTTDPLSLVLLGVFLEFIVIRRLKPVAARLFIKKD